MEGLKKFSIEPGEDTSLCWLEVILWWMDECGML